MNAVTIGNGEHQVPFELGREIDPQKLSERFRERAALRIPDFLDPVGALALYRHLASDVPWTTFLVADNTMYSAEAEAAATEPPAPEIEAQMRARAHEGARKGFASLYDANRLFPEDAPEGVEIPSARDTPLLRHFSEFLNSSPFLRLCATVTGLSQIARADIQATRFRPGHFVMFHSTLPYSRKRGQRLAAFEINLTVEWRPEWGGLRELKGAADFSADTYIPSFNLLDLFSPYRGRWISMVTSLAEGERLGLSGWLYGP